MNSSKFTLMDYLMIGGFAAILIIAAIMIRIVIIINAFSERFGRKKNEKQTVVH